MKSDKEKEKKVTTIQHLVSPHLLILEKGKNSTCSSLVIGYQISSCNSLSVTFTWDLTRETPCTPLLLLIIKLRARRSVRARTSVVQLAYLNVKTDRMWGIHHPLSPVKLLRALRIFPNKNRGFYQFPCLFPRVYPLGSTGKRTGQVSVLVPRALQAPSSSWSYDGPEACHGPFFGGPT